MNLIVISLESSGIPVQQMKRAGRRLAARLAQ
jgi:hypothetical protein